jgi:hypothetical protein
MDDLVIDEKNFSQYFKEIDKSHPQKGDVLVAYRSMADFCDGELKEQVVEALFEEKIGPSKAIKLMKKLGKTSNREAFRVVKNIFMDLYNGMSKSMVTAKTYEFMVEIYYYAKEEYVPKDNSHWEIIKIKNLDDHLSKVNIENDIQYIDHAENQEKGN